MEEHDSNDAFNRQALVLPTKAPALILGGPVPLAPGGPKELEYPNIGRRFRASRKSLPCLLFFSCKAQQEPAAVERNRARSDRDCLQEWPCFAATRRITKKLDTTCHRRQDAPRPPTTRFRQRLPPKRETILGNGFSRPTEWLSIGARYRWSAIRPDGDIIPNFSCITRRKCGLSAWGRIKRVSRDSSVRLK